jgi:5-methylcytosine-specific restriction endonuclease McrA
VGWEWRQVRYDFLKEKGRRCQCCGRTPEQDGVRIVVDHILPLRRFWSSRLDPGNLQLLCDDCNQGKGSRDTTDWRPKAPPLQPEAPPVASRVLLEALDECFR